MGGRYVQSLDGKWEGRERNERSVVGEGGEKVIGRVC